ncbi:MAG: HaeIII family restriction endonuclease [Bacteroides sp.]|nr:HaeIII family restriction endonuclease [Bacteroides sp.]
MSLYDRIKELRPVSIVENGNFNACKKEWETLPDDSKNLFLISALSAAEQILELEPRIEENDGDDLTLLLQADVAGENGDVRDILIIRSTIRWEIGLSIKHNHFAVKHSRLATNLDFGLSWFGMPCSETYWREVAPIFQYLNEEKSRGTLFRQLENKEKDVYAPILNSFKSELGRILSIDKTMPSRLVEYLIGKFDFYKVISVDSQRYTSIQAVNLHKTLNQSSKTKVSTIEIPIVKFPTRLIHLDFIPNSRTTLELYLNDGWQFTFRIHNASTKVEPSLKFDIQIVGMPTSVITINRRWMQ